MQRLNKAVLIVSVVGVLTDNDGKNIWHKKLSVVEKGLSSILAAIWHKPGRKFHLE